MNKKITLIIILLVIIAGIGIFLLLWKPPQLQEECGDKVCDTTNESCETCSEDCGECPIVSGESHFGMGGGLPMFADELKEAGVEVVRQWIKWDDIEKQNDVYDWTEMDDVVQSANDVGIEVLGYFINMPVWARNSENPKCRQTGKGTLLDICEPKNWEDFKEFARNVSERYDGTKNICGEQGNEFCGEMKYIGIFNEAQLFSKMNSSEYGPWLINGYLAIKQGNPNAQVLLGAVLAPIDFPASSKFIDQMLEDYSQHYDIFNFHIYHDEDDSVLKTINYMKERMEFYNVDKPMWITETAHYPFLVPCNNLEWQKDMAESVIKRYAYALGNNVDKVFWYVINGFATEEENSTYGLECGAQSNFNLGGLGWVFPKGQGLDIFEFHPRPTYYTYKLMTSKLTGFTSVTRLTDTQYEFIVNDKSVYVLWCDEGPCYLPADIRSSTSQFKVTDYLGNEETKLINEISLTDSPVFVE